MTGPSPAEVRAGSCPSIPGISCTASPCPGAADTGVCKHLAAIGAWRSLVEDEQVARLSEPRASVSPAVRDAVNACPDRGPVLPLSMQDDCGCRGRELSACRAGRGEVPGRVTLLDCLACKAEHGHQKTPGTSGD